MKTKKSKFLGVVCLAMCIVLFIVGLWSFNFYSRNEVAWLQSHSGIIFNGRGIVFTQDPLEISRLFQNTAISIELWLEPDTDALWHDEHSHWHYGQILSLYNKKGKKELFSIGQWKSSLEIRSRYSNSENDKKIGFGNTLKTGKKRFITITSAPGGTTIYSNGKPEYFNSDYSLIAGNNSRTGTIVLGNSPTGKKPWRGKLFGCALYNTQLTDSQVFKHYQMWTKHNYLNPIKGGGAISLYLFNEAKGTVAHNTITNKYNLQLPIIFKVLQKIILESPFKGFRWNLTHKDYIINILGFIPFGFLFSAYLRNTKKDLPRHYVYSVSLLMGICISLTIELLQIYLPTRTSSITDLLCNTLGTFLGIFLSRRPFASLRATGVDSL